MSRRWVCPSCGKGVLGPDRPRRDDVRRYCLDCSAKTGRLVERTAPAVEKARTAKREKSAAKSAQRVKRERETEVAKRSVGGIDMLSEAKRLWRMPSLKAEKRWRDELPRITFRKTTRAYHPRTSGHCAIRTREITVTLGTDATYAAECVLHELAHAAVGPELHSRRFWSVLRSAAREAWPEAVFDFSDGQDVGWRCDRAIADGIRQLA